MNAKLKAYDLLNKFTESSKCEFSKNCTVDTFEQAKQCAIIAVKEIIDALYHSESEENLYIDISYFKEVHRELSLLEHRLL